MPTFTPTQQKIVDLLSDGERHAYGEVKKCLWDELSEDITIHIHVSNIRKKLIPIGENIICEHHNGTGYFRHVVLLNSRQSQRALVKR